MGLYNDDCRFISSQSKTTHRVCGHFSSSNQRQQSLNKHAATFIGMGAAIAAMAMPAATLGAYITVFGGPTWDETTQTGYARSYTEHGPGSSVGNGVAVGDAATYFN